jgi:predicted MFS family arabinose efflux permease
MSIFFGIAGALTAIGPIAGGYLTQWTWRSIFWINIPVALVALVLIWVSKPDDERRPASLDHVGTLLITASMALMVLGLQQSGAWGWSSAATWTCIVVGLLLMVAFVRWELEASEPLLRLDIFRDRGFAVETAALGFTSVAFLPFFFFGSVYAQVSLGETATKAGEYILYFFLGYVIASLIGGRILDRRGARPAVVVGSALGAVGFYLLAGKLTHLSLGAQSGDIMLAGAGIGLMLTPASTDAVSRAPRASYSEVTGITQTARYFGASLGLAVLGALLISETKTKVAGALTRHGVPESVADRVASSFGSAASSGASRSGALAHEVELAFAHSLQPVFYAMAGVLALTFLITLLWLPRGRLEPADRPLADAGGAPLEAVEEG